MPSFVIATTGAFMLSGLIALQTGTPAGQPPAKPATPPTAPAAPARPADVAKPAAPAAAPAKPADVAKPADAAKPGDADLKAKSIFTFDAKTLEGEPARLDQYKGKVVMVVNVASRCGYTPQYEGLQKLYEQYKDKGLVILAFPSNDFGGQEPGTSKEIRDFCTSQYKVTFPLFEKVSVKPGDQQSPLFKALGAKTDQSPKWNFSKYVVSRDGTKAEFFESKVTPDAKPLREAIEKALATP